MFDGADWDACVMRAWPRLATDRLAQSQQQIDAVNVFPVADHDTGKNMLAAMRAGCAACQGPQAGPEGRFRTAADVAANLWQGVLAGARGNSGIILTQFWRAVAETSARRRLDAECYAEVLSSSAALIGEAVARPVEGTAWSVLRAAAERARELVSEGRVALSEVVVPVVEAAAFAEAVEEESAARPRWAAEAAATAADPEPIRPDALAMLANIGPAEPPAAGTEVAAPAALAEHMRARHPGIELVVLGGGQPGEIAQVGVE